MEEIKREGKYNNVDMIIGDPKKAIRKLAMPIIISMFITMSYNFANGIWVAGLGTDTLAALGFTFPLFMIIIGVGIGLGSGASSLIARSIGAKNKKKAENAAIHSILISIIISIILTIFFLIFLEDILIFMGAGETLELALSYGYLLMGGSILFIFPQLGASILRSEGNAKLPMYAMAVTAILNIIIDPIFIYTLNMGIAGAAWANIISGFISCIFIGYLLFVKKDNYLSLEKKNFKYNKKIMKDILNVGLPTSTEMFLFSILSMVMNYILVTVSGSTAVAIFTAGYRILNIAEIPYIGLGTATITVGGAAFGAHQFEKMSVVFNYAIKIGLIISVITAIVFLSASIGIFTYTDSINSGLTTFIQIMALYIIPLPISMISACILQGAGKGIESLIISIIRELITTITFTVIFTFIFSFAEKGVLWGLVVGGLVGSIIAYTWVKIFIDKLKSTEN